MLLSVTFINLLVKVHLPATKNIGSLQLSPAVQNELVYFISNKINVTTQKVIKGKTFYRHGDINKILLSLHFHRKRFNLQ